MPSDGFADLPWPTPSGMMMKYLAVSSGWPLMLRWQGIS
jgi:hypothetical protein